MEKYKERKGKEVDETEGEKLVRWRKVEVGREGRREVYWSLKPLHYLARRPVKHVSYLPSFSSVMTRVDSVT